MAQKTHTIARLGNDIGVTWAIFQQVPGVTWRTPLDLEGIPISLKLYNPLTGEKPIVDFTVESNKIHWTFKGKDQTKPGRYTLTLTTNPGLDNQHVVDRIDFLELVSRSNVSVLPAGTIHGRNSSMDVDVINITSVVDQMYETVAHAAQAYASLESLIQEKQDIIPDLEDIRDGAAAGATAQQPHPYTSLERLSSRLFRISFAELPPEGGADSVPGACTSFVRDGKLYRNLDWNYDDAPSFILQCPGFEGMSFLSGITDSDIPDDLAAQLPYHLVDGRNEHGIMVSAHVLFNDWDWHGSGAQDIPLYKLPFLVLTTLTSLDNIEEDLADILGNLTTTPAFDSAGYLLQVLVTDGTDSYVLTPPVTDGSYEVVDISANPKLTNFRWVPDATVIRTSLQTRPTGVERWNAIGAQTRLQDMRFTKAYEADDRLSEFIGLRGTTKNSTDAELEEIYEEARALYRTRTRDGSTWQTMHSAVYSANGLEELYVQEDWTRNYSDVIPDVSGFITRSVNDLLNYYLKSETYTRTEVQALIAAIQQVSFVPVPELPEASAATLHKIYLVPSSNPKIQNVKDEYITVESSGSYSWEQIGSTAIDLSDYVTVQALNTALSGYVTTAALLWGAGTGENSIAHKYASCTASGKNSLASGASTTAEGENSHAEGSVTRAEGVASHSEGYNTKALQNYAHAEGNGTQVAALGGHAEGNDTSVTGNYGHSEGMATKANGAASHAEGNGCTASGEASHAEGKQTTASANSSHAEGYNTTASANTAHAEGSGTTASDVCSHAEGRSTVASGYVSHAEGESTSASSNYTHAEGYNTQARNNSEHAQGRFNKSNQASGTFGDAGNTIHSVGIGTSGSARKNAVEIMQNGDAYLIGVGGYDGTNPENASTLQDSLGGQPSTLTEAPSDGKTYGRNNTTWVEINSSRTMVITDTESTMPTQQINNNSEYRYTQNLQSITISFPTMTDDYIGGLVFNSGNIATVITYPTMKWSGDDIVAGAFTPAANKTYNIVFWYDGININGVARGV